MFYCYFLSIFLLSISQAPAWESPILEAPASLRYHSQPFSISQAPAWESIVPEAPASLRNHALP
jgi:hypothetical protein